MANELLRIVEAIQRERNIDKEVVFLGIESAIASAVRKHYGSAETVEVVIDRETGRICATESGREINPEELGRIAAQTAKQVIIQKIREAEADMLYEEYVGKVGQLVTGTVHRFEGPNLVINLGKAEGFMPSSEQIPGESYRAGDRIRAIIIEVSKSGPRLRIVLSRKHPDLVKRLFELEVPEVSERIIDIKCIAREAGFRTKIAVSSSDPKVDCVGACVGVRGTRIKNTVDELSGEKIDIVRYNEYPEIMIMNCLKPAEIDSLVIEEGEEEGEIRATVMVREDQLSLAIGKKGRNVRLAAELAGCSIDIVPLPTSGDDEGRPASLIRAGGGAKAAAVPEELAALSYLSLDEQKALDRAGLKSAVAISFAGEERVAAIDGIGAERAAQIFEAMNNPVQDESQEDAEGDAETPEEPANDAETPEEPANDAEAPEESEADETPTPVESDMDNDEAQEAPGSESDTDETEKAEE